MTSVRFALLSFPVLCAAFAPSPAIFATKPYQSDAFARIGRLSGGAAITMSTAAAPVENSIYVQPGYRRPLHWVFKIGSLDKSLEFYEKLFGMHVHRHEEFASGCEATCNGPYGGAWSKTMIGYGKEATNFALELTYNYGIDSYASGNDLRYIAMRSSSLRGDPAAMGYAVSTDPTTGNRIISGPDGYKFMLVDAAVPGEDPFLYVSIHVSDLAKSTAFYTEVMGFKVFDAAPGTLAGRGGVKSVVVGFDDKATKLELVALPAGGKVDHAKASGRWATETEDGVPFKMGETVKAAGVGRVLHGPIKLQPHNEEVVIVEDPDGYEYCFVDARGFNNCINVAYKEGGTTVNWDFRRRLEAASRAPTNAKLEVAKVLAGDYDAAAVRAKIDARLKEAPVVVFSQTSCPFCAKAKQRLGELGAKHLVVELDTLGDEGNAWRVELAKISGRGTVPQVFVGGNCIGGFSDGVEQLDKEGRLQPLLQSAGAL